MRVAHATDIHWFHPPGLRHFAFKRLVGTANLYLRGRRHEFDEQVQQALVDHLREQKPDLVVITGDLTAQALPEEFEKARAALDPLLTEVPVFVVPGNHDVYAPDAVQGRWFHEWFGPWSGAGKEPIARLDLDDITVLGLDPNRPTWLTASGYVPDEQLAALAKALEDRSLDDRRVILATHYPPIDRHGRVYDRRSHGLLNAGELIRVLEGARRRPDLVCSGHLHHGFKSEMVFRDGTRVPVVNSGTSGQSFQPDRGRAASSGSYAMADDPIEFGRFRHDGKLFVPEPGGAFSTGR